MSHLTDAIPSRHARMFELMRQTHQADTTRARLAGAARQGEAVTTACAFRAYAVESLYSPGTDDPTPQTATAMPRWPSLQRLWRIPVPRGARATSRDTESLDAT